MSKQSKNIVVFTVFQVQDENGVEIDLWRWSASNSESKDIVSYSAHWSRQSAIDDAEVFIAFVLAGANISVERKW